MIFTLYKIINTINSKCYIGQSKRVRDRWSAHKRLAVKVLNGGKLGDAGIQLIHIKMAEYGIDNFKFKILDECDTQSGANIKEAYLAKESLVPNGYNVIPGGKVVSGSMHPCYGTKISEEHKKRIIEANTGRRHTTEAKEKLRKANIGKTISIETRKKLSDINKGKIPWNKGKALTAEHKEKISESKMGITTCKGYRHSEKTRKKMSESRSGYKSNAHKLTVSQAKEIRQRYQNEKISTRALGKEFGVSKQTISRIVKNKTYIAEGIA